MSKVILLAYCPSFKMRYWEGLCDFRKSYWSCFCGYPHPNSIVNAKCKDLYFSFEWSKWVGKKNLRKNLCCWSTFVFCSTLYSQILKHFYFLLELRSWTPRCHCDSAALWLHQPPFMEKQHQNTSLLSLEVNLGHKRPFG